MDLRSFLVVLRRHRLLVVATMAGVVLVALAVDGIRGEEHTAETTLRLRTAEVAVPGVDVIEYADRLQATYTDLVATRSFRDEVAREVGLDEVPAVSLWSSGSELVRLRATASEASAAIAAADGAARLLVSVVQSQVEPALAPLVVIDPAGPDTALEGPGTLPVAALAAFTGLLAGLGLAVVRENVRDETRSGAEAAGLLGATFLGALRPVDRAGNERDPVAAETAALRLAEEDGNVWAVLGDRPATVRQASSGLARAMTRLGMRPVVVECQRSGPPRPDLTEVVAGRAPLEVAVAEVDGLPRAGLRWGGAERLVRPGTVDKATVRLREQFDLVVVEAPRSTSGATWLVLASVVGFVVVVLADEHVPRRDLLRLREEIESVGGRITGVLVARTRGGRS